MWNILTSIKDQVTKYSTWFGQLWYLCVFLFRLIVVVTIGGAVYGGELGEFECSTGEPGCKTMCFNQFQKMSHIRFWSFQLLAVATPTVLFHFYSLSVAGEIQKMKEESQAHQKVNDAQSEFTVGPPGSYDDEEGEKVERQKHKLEKRKKKIGHVKFKKVYTGSALQEIPYTNKIHLAYFVNVILRLAIEAVFIVLAYQLFSVMDYSALSESSSINFLVFSVPAMYRCEDNSPAVRMACSQAIGIGGVVPCWVSRPYEKTILVRYMSILSAFCFLLSAFEMVYLAFKGYLGHRKKADKRAVRRLDRRTHRGGSSNASQYNQTTMRSVPVYVSTGNGHAPYDSRDLYPSLAVADHDAMSSVTGHVTRAPVAYNGSRNGVHPSVSRVQAIDNGQAFDKMTYILPGHSSMDVIHGEVDGRPYTPSVHRNMD